MNEPLSTYYFMRNTLPSVSVLAFAKPKTFMQYNFVFSFAKSVIYFSPLNRPLNRSIMYMYCFMLRTT